MKVLGIQSAESCLKTFGVPRFSISWCMKTTSSISVLLYDVVAHPHLYSELDQRVFIKKESRARLLLADSLHPLESYRGSENTITMKTLNKANFICSFDELERYPFNSQICKFKFFVLGTDNIVTDLKIIGRFYEGPMTVDQYIVVSFSMAEDNVTEDSRGPR